MQNQLAEVVKDKEEMTKWKLNRDDHIQFLEEQKNDLQENIIEYQSEIDMNNEIFQSLAEILRITTNQKADIQTQIKDKVDWVMNELKAV